MSETTPSRFRGTNEDVVLEVEDLRVSFETDDGSVDAVRGLSYQVRRGEALGIVGESGSGKSVSSLAVMGLLPRTATVTGSVRILGQELVGLKDKQMMRVRGKRIAMIFQDPLTSLTPVYTAGTQVIEALRAHDPKLSDKDAHERAVELLRIVGIPDPARRIDAYPHELSGGMRQRVVIAIAIANDPDVIIADEPTTALDVTVQAQVLEALQRAKSETGAALILITHDLGVVAGHADRVTVMYAGRAVESGSVEDIFYRPRMPYTLGLLGSLPRMDETRPGRLTPILGTPPSLLNLPPGCPFAPRCPAARERCTESEPDLVAVDATGTHHSACLFHEELIGKSSADLFRPTARDDVLPDVPPDAPEPGIAGAGR
jgi:peptide/nickel transport system ATP-binding protein